MNTGKDIPAENVVLRLDGISKTFPGVKALSDMSIDLRHGEVHAVCGENGAGKSTLMKIITGVYQPDCGEIHLYGESVKVLHPNDAYAKGVAIIFQETSLFPDLTVLENIFMGHELTFRMLGKQSPVLDYPAMREKASGIFARLGMDMDLDVRVSSLGVATKQMVEIAKALSFDSRILILDEPTAALTSKEVDTLFDTIAKLREHGVSMLYISHRLDEIFQIADRVTVIRDGEFVRTQDVKDVKKEDLVSWMVGRTLSNLYPKDDAEIGNIVLDAQNITQNGVLDNVSLTLRKGEILGLSGLAGAGRTELALAMCGLTPLDGGEITINGTKAVIADYRDAMSKGLVYVSEDRQKYGLVIQMSVKENISFPLLTMLANRLGLIRRKKERTITDEYVKNLAIKTPGFDFVVNNLSGGNQQKVCLSKALATEPQILILDEPTRGIDVGSKHQVYKIMSELVKQGKSIIMISSDLPEILGMSDRVVVMKGGRKQGELVRSELSQEKILRMAL